MRLFYFFVLITILACIPRPKSDKPKDHSGGLGNEKQNSSSTSGDKKKADASTTSTNSTKAKQLRLVSHQVKTDFIAASQQDWFRKFNQFMSDSTFSWGPIHSHFATNDLKTMRRNHKKKIAEVRTMFAEQARSSDFYEDIRNLDLDEIIFYMRSKHGFDDEKLIEEGHTQPFSGATLSLCQPKILGNGYSIWFDTVLESLGFFTIETRIFYALSSQPLPANHGEMSLDCDAYRRISEPIVFHHQITVADPIRANIGISPKGDAKQNYRTDVLLDISFQADPIAYSAVYLNSEDAGLVAVLEENNFLGLSKWKPFTPTKLANEPFNEFPSTVYSRFYQYEVCPAGLLFVPGIANGALTEYLVQTEKEGPLGLVSGNHERGRNAVLAGKTAILQALADSNRVPTHNELQKERGLSLTGLDFKDKQSCNATQRTSYYRYPTGPTEFDGSSPKKRPYVGTIFDYSIEVDQLIRFYESIASEASDMNDYIREGLSQ